MGAEQVTFDLREPAIPEALLRPDPGWVWLAAAGILIAGITGVLIFRWNRRRTRDTPGSRRDAAFKDASRALGQIAGTDARQCAVQSSLILRQYLSIAADDPALFETHEEFVSRHEALACLTESARAACAAGFARLAAFKYAPQIPVGDPLEIVAGARDLLDVLHRGFQG